MIKAYVVFTTVSYQIYLFIMSTLFIHQNETDSTNRYLADTYRTAAPDMPIRTAEMVIVEALSKVAPAIQDADKAHIHGKVHVEKTCYVLCSCIHKA